MIFKLSNNPEYTIYLNLDIGYWALPFAVSWFSNVDGKDNVNRDLSIRFLCFSFIIETWKWSKETLND